MGRLIRTFENRTVLFFGIAVLLTAGLFFGLGYLSVGLSEREAAIEASERMLAAAGRLSERGDIPDEVIAAAFADKSTAEAQRGSEIMKNYGYELGTTRGFEFIVNGSVLPAVTAGAGVLFCGILGLTAVYIIIREIRCVTSAGSKKKRCSADFSDNDIVLLAEAVNRLTDDRLGTLERLSGEKRYLADYLQDFSHQIRTPASGLTLNNEIMRSHELPRSEQLEYLERDRVCIERINRLCAESLKSARLDAGAVKYEIKLCSVAELTERSCSPLYELASSNGTDLSIDIPSGIMLECDELWLGEAVSNLVKNACEHTVNGSVTVTADETPMTVNIYITDDGEGIANEDIPQLFRRFYSKRSDRNPTSVGIGMSIAKRITEDMNGRIYIDSEQGFGTKVRLEFLKRQA